jgi:uncharacterized protein (TIGR02588 family)
MQFSVRNTGDATAAKLNLTVSLIIGKDVVETSETTFDYAPAKSVRHGGAFFVNDPSKHEVRIRAEGYSKP